MTLSWHLSDSFADFLAGWVAGCSGVAVSHPFDTVKVRLQTQGVLGGPRSQYSGTMHCLVETIKKEKVHGLYKGITPPLLGTAAWNAVVFGVYGNTISYLAKNDPSEKHNLTNITLAAVNVAIAQSVIICPIELIKTRLQVQTSAETLEYKGVIDCIKKIYSRNGMRGFFLGMNATIIRDIPGFISYFNAYEIICRLLSGSEQSILGPLALMFAGGIAGTISWTLVFPPDVIKTRIQVDNWTNYSGFIDCLKKSYGEEKWRLFTRGLAPTVIRAFPMNAAIFTVYTLLMRLHYSRRNQDEFQTVSVDTT